MEWYSRCICKESKKKNEKVKSRSGAEKSSYLYYKRLQFLQSTIKKNSKESNFETEDVGGDGNLELSTENSIEEDCSRVSNEEGTFKSFLQQRKKKLNFILLMSTLPTS